MFQINNNYSFINHLEMKTFEYCSLKYLTIYQQIDKDIIAGLKPENKTDNSNSG